AGDAVAHLDGQRLRAGDDILPAHEIGRAAGTEELLALRQRVGLGGIGGDFRAPLAEFRRLRRDIAGAGAIERPVRPQELGTGDAGLEIAPQDVAVAALEPDIELAVGRRVLDHGRIVAIDRIVVVGIELAQQMARILVAEIAEQAAQLVLAGIGRRRQEGLALDLALQIEGKPALGIDLFIFARSHRLNAGAALALADGEIGKGDVEPVIGRNVDLAREMQAARFRRPGQGDVDLVIAGRQDALDDEPALPVDGDDLAEGADRIAGGNVAAMDGDGAAMDLDVAHGSAVLAHAGRYG